MSYHAASPGLHCHSYFLIDLPHIQARHRGYDTGATARESEVQNTRKASLLEAQFHDGGDVAEVTVTGEEASGRAGGGDGHFPIYPQPACLSAFPASEGPGQAEVLRRNHSFPCRYGLKDLLLLP